MFSDFVASLAKLPDPDLMDLHRMYAMSSRAKCTSIRLNQHVIAQKRDIIMNHIASRVPENFLVHLQQVQQELHIS